MPRGRRKFATKEEELFAINEAIEKQQEILKDLKKKRDEIEQSIQDEQVNRIYLLMKSKGISLEQMEALIEA